jgi:transcriptional regulator with XRE-family HTH domain
MLLDLTSFGGLLIYLRGERGLSQFALSVACGWPGNYVNRLESGKVSPSRETIAALATGLALDADDTGRLYVAAGLLPPGQWIWLHGWCVRPASDMPKEETTT